MRKLTMGDERKKTLPFIVYALPKDQWQQNSTRDVRS
jgi:hypothetical protein